jgi:hypothetical protein
MTEKEWLEGTDPEPMLEVLGKKASKRKSQLFACACCRHIWSLIENERSRRAVEVTERFAEGQATRREWDNARRAAYRTETSADSKYRSARITANEIYRTAGPDDPYQAQPDFVAAISATKIYIAANAASSASRAGTQWGLEAPIGTAKWCQFAIGSDPLHWKQDLSEATYQCHLIREIFGNPFRPVIFDPSWLTPTVTAIAQTIYDDRRFADLPFLADALEEAGCDNAEILHHCRGTEFHSRGCWVVDLVLGKE